MEVRYGHDVENNYIIINHPELLLNDYKLNMMLKNEIKGLLKVCVSCVDGKAELTYTISSKQSISELYEKKKMNYDEVFLVISSFVTVCRTLHRYLLKPDDILLEKELVFLDYQSGEVVFCYYPDSGREVYTEFRNFVQELMTITNHEDRKAVELIYGVFDICNNNFLVKDIENFIETGNHKEMDNREEKQESVKEFAKESVKKSEKECAQDLHKVYRNADMEEYHYNMREYDGKELENVSETNHLYHVAAGMHGQTVMNRRGRSDIKNDNSSSDNRGSKNNTIIKKVKGIFGSKVYRVPDKADYDNICYPSGNGIKEEYKTSAAGIEDIYNDDSPDLQVCGDTLYIKDIISSTRRRLLSLTEKSNIEIVHYPFIIGKLSARVDYVLEDKSVSRIHMRISKDSENNYYIEDMNSKNGTFLNGIRTEPYEKVKIEIGDKIGIATYEYIFR